MVRLFTIVSICVSFLCVFNFGAEAKVKAATDTLRQLIDTVISIPANPEVGFNYPYYLRIPKGVIKGIRQHLLVETNNTGVNDTLSYHDAETLKQVKRNSLGSSLCSNLKLPFLMPVFPRPAKNWKVYTHALDRETALLKSGAMYRLDLQLIAMIKDAQKLLSLYDIELHDKILMNGFSASGTFANRFTIIHPEKVAAVAYGGVNGLVILPVKSIASTSLDYPLGINDFTKIYRKEVNLTEYRQVPQYIYMGANDNNDAVLFDDAYSKKERNKVFSEIGKTMLPDRFKNCQAVYESNKINAKFTIYPGIGHETDKTVFLDVYGFFKNVMNAGMR